MTDSRYQRMQGRYTHAATQAAESGSFIRPEILAIPAARLKKYLAAKVLSPYRLQLERLVRYKPHTLSRGEEKLLAMQSEMAHAADKMFRQLTDADLKFGMIRDKGHEVELSNSTFSLFLHSPDREIRRKAFHQFYEQYQGHENSLAAAFSSSVQKDVYYAKARNHPSALEASLFHDNVPVSVYDNLIAAVRAKLPALYDYFELRRKKMRLKDLHSTHGTRGIKRSPRWFRPWSPWAAITAACSKPASLAAGATAIRTRANAAAPSAAARTTAGHTS
jgi:oligoendopeptidase F